ncbi:T9SS type A sorting domain-containing protein [Aurantibacillus circumpalustris]|uniref:T9SS type A sorting domain-containing protein n=1 Tax=Aurantibacillus circumpalustris TaxID=3036359 RepID=UPI00295BA309|nr:T9SS type A sorting domain-containing protein [Aurantibacillus circumpalustris]
MKYSLVIFLFFICTVLYSQKETNNWYFGVYAGISFNSTPPVAVTNGSLFSNEGCASISDSNGNLLFYTNGEYIWNALHQIMANGAGLLGDYSSTQSSIIIKQPGSDSLYYVFTLDDQGLPNGLRYSIVDMSLAAGTGSVITKNVLLYAPSAEKLAATRHCNGIDVWILSHETSSSNFRAYLLTSSGVNPTPVVSQIGSYITYYSVGQMKISPNGRKLGQAINENYALELFDFDNSSGVLSNSLSLGSFTATPYGCEFSPDGSIFYGGTSFSNSPIYQWDLCAGSNSAIIASKTAISTSTIGTSSLQLASNGKIYVAKYLSQQFVDVINSPNSLGMACNYQDTAIVLSPKFASSGLPAFLSNYFKSLAAPFTFTNNSSMSCNQVLFNEPANSCTAMAYPLNSLTWLFGDSLSGSANTSTLSNPTHVFSSSGTYTVKLALNYNCNSDTLVQVITLSSAPMLTVSGVFNSCPGDKRIYSAAGASSYSWSTGTSALSMVVSPTATTIYTVIGNHANSACKSTSVFTVNVSPCAGMRQDQLPDGPVLKIYPNPSGSYFTIESKQKIKITVFDHLGRLVYSAELVEGVNHIPADALESGIYFISTSIKGGEKYKLVKTK